MAWVPSFHAFAIVQAGVEPTLALNRGFKSFQRIDTGEYDFELDQHIDENESVPIISRLEGASSTGVEGFEHVSDRDKRVSITANGAAADVDFSLAILGIR